MLSFPSLTGVLILWSVWRWCFDVLFGYKSEGCRRFFSVLFKFLKVGGVCVVNKVKGRVFCIRVESSLKWLTFIHCLLLIKTVNTCFLLIKSITKILITKIQMIKKNLVREIMIFYIIIKNLKRLLLLKLDIEFSFL